MTELTVVIPIKNEAPALEQLYRELTDTLTAWGRPYEVIFVDDGSTDDSSAGTSDKPRRLPQGSRTRADA